MGLFMNKALVEKDGMASEVQGGEPLGILLYLRDFGTSFHLSDDKEN
jgi:hypothetical protein